MAFIPQSGSVLAFQGTVPFSVLGQNVGSVISVQQGSIAAAIVSGSISATFTPPANQSVSGTVGASVIGHAPVVIVGGSIAASFNPPANQSVSGTVEVGNFPANQSVSGAVSVSNFPTTQNVSGSVAAWLQSTNASVITVGSPVANQSVSGTVQVDVLGSVATVIIGGSIATTTGNSSVQVLNFPANQSVSGTVGTTQQGTWISSIVNTVPSSVIVGASAFGTFPVTQATTPWNVAGSVAAFQVGTYRTSVINSTPSSLLAGVSILGQLPAGTAPIGSVAVLQGTNPWAATNVGSIISLNIGSVINVTQGSVAAAIINVPQASVHGTVKIFPSSIVSGHGSVNGAASVQVLAAPGAGLHNYVTDFFISNTGEATTLVTFTDGDGSVMGKTIAPAGGGSNGTSISTPMRTLQTNKVVNIAAATASSVVHAWIGGFRAP